MLECNRNAMVIVYPSSISLLGTHYFVHRLQKWKVITDVSVGLVLRTV
jgi:hypothetical protein